MIKVHVYALLCALAVSPAAAQTTSTKPNILWITTEDMSPNLGCYGDKTAKTPTLDKLATEGCRYTRAFSSSPVCSASRSAIITGMYATSIGTQNHRSKVEIPAGVRCFPAYLREAGYYCTNNSKTDYNFDVPADAWDENSGKAHWRKRPNKDQPFFAVFNLTTTHESKFHESDEKIAELIRDVPPEDRTSTEAVTLPPYIPATPLTLKDRARYYDIIAEMDHQVANFLKQLDEDGLATNTIVMFFSDHGVGLPRGKRWLYDSGTQVPLMVRWPGHVKPGTTNEELVSLLDMAPTLLSLAGVPPVERMEGRRFMGERKQPEPKYLFQTRDRMDETYDMMRSVRGRQFLYIKNFYPEKPYDLVIQYAEQTPTLKELRRLNAAGALEWPATWFFQKEKPADELYDTAADPWEIKNLADDPAQADRLKEMRTALEKWQKATGDKGLVPETSIPPQEPKKKNRRQRKAS
jgi:uncharacterized sulfatase